MYIYLSATLRARGLMFITLDRTGLESVECFFVECLKDLLLDVP